MPYQTAEYHPDCLREYKDRTAWVQEYAKILYSPGSGSSQTPHRHPPKKSVASGLCHLLYPSPGLVTGIGYVALKFWG